MKIKILTINLITLVLLSPLVQGGEDRVLLIRSGDTARKIGEEYLVRPTSWERVVQYNYILKPGSAIKVPAELIKAEGKAFLTSTRGEVSVKLKGEGIWQPAPKGLVLQSGDRIKTGYNSAAGLNFSDHDRAVLRSETEVIFEYQRHILKGNSDRLTVVRGEIIASGNGTGRHPTRYEIKTPNSRGVLKGTVLRTKVLKSGETRYEVLSGELSVTADGKTSVIPSGSGVTIPKPEE